MNAGGKARFLQRQHPLRKGSVTGLRRLRYIGRRTAALVYVLPTYFPLDVRTPVICLTLSQVGFDGHAELRPAAGKEDTSAACSFLSSGKSWIRCGRGELNWHCVCVYFDR